VSGVRKEGGYSPKKIKHREIIKASYFRDKIVVLGQITKAVHVWGP
jgi:hypothetical protein